MGKKSKPEREESKLGSHFGSYGGVFVPETLMSPLEELEQAYLADASQVERKARAELGMKDPENTWILMVDE